jgi:hypothetical protein
MSATSSKAMIRSVMPFSHAGWNVVVEDRRDVLANNTFLSVIELECAGSNPVWIEDDGRTFGDDMSGASSEGIHG